MQTQFSFKNIENHLRDPIRQFIHKRSKKLRKFLSGFSEEVLTIRWVIEKHPEE